MEKMMNSLNDALNAFGAAFPQDDSYRRWLSERRLYAFFFAAVYVVVVFGGQRLMKNRKPLPLSRAFLAWNIFLALFSIAGTICVLPEFIHSFMNDGIYLSYCKTNAEYYTGLTGYWVYLFHASKLFELGDTLFLIGRKRPVIFLHWYHHCTVLGYTWMTYGIDQGPRRWGVLMNFLIHSFMYTYYALKSARMQCPKFLAPSITTMQIAQFVAGTFFLVHIYYVNWSTGVQDSCQATFWPTAIAVVIYHTYFALFCKFFYESYLDKSSTTNKFRKSTAAHHKKTESNGHHAPALVNGLTNGTAFSDKKRD